MKHCAETKPAGLACGRGPITEWNIYSTLTFISEYTDIVQFGLQSWKLELLSAWEADKE